MIRAQFDRASLKKIFEQARVQMDSLIIQRMLRVGKDLVDNARETGDYENQTHNLRSSIGCLALRNGQIVESYWPGDKDEGVETGTAYANEIAGEYPVGFVLIVVAGMKYAGWVEAYGYDVLTMAALRAEEELKASFGIGFKIRGA